MQKYLLFLLLGVLLVIGGGKTLKLNPPLQFFFSNPVIVVINSTQSTVMGVKGENIDPHQEFILEIVIILHRQALG